MTNPRLLAVLADAGCTTLDEYLNPAVRPVLSIPDAGALLGLDRFAAYKAARSGHLPCIQISERRMVTPTSAMRTLLIDTDDDTPSHNRQEIAP